MNDFLGGLKNWWEIDLPTFINGGRDPYDVPKNIMVPGGNMVPQALPGSSARQQQDKYNPAPKPENQLSFNDFVKKNNNGRDMFGNGGGTGLGNPNYAPAPQPQKTAGVEEALMGYLDEIRTRLNNSRATPAEIALNTKPIEQAREASMASLQAAMDSVLGSLNGARANTKSNYNLAKEDTQASYDALEARSRKEGKANAESSGDRVSSELEKAASVAMAGINTEATDDKALRDAARANLGGGGSAAEAAIMAKVDPNGRSNQIRDNIAQTYQSEAGNAAEETARQVNAASRFSDTLGAEGASAIADLMAQLAGRMGDYDRDEQGYRNGFATNKASLESTYADKVMQAQLAQQQAQNSANQQAWQFNTQNDANALQGMIDLSNQTIKSNQESDSMAARAERDAANAKNDQILATLKGFFSNTDRNTASLEQIQGILAQLGM